MSKWTSDIPDARIYRALIVDEYGAVSFWEYLRRTA